MIFLHAYTHGGEGGPRFIALSQGFLWGIESAKNFDSEEIAQSARKAYHVAVKQLCGDHGRLCLNTAWETECAADGLRGAIMSSPGAEFEPSTSFLRVQCFDRCHTSHPQRVCHCQCKFSHIDPTVQHRVHQQMKTYKYVTAGLRLHRNVLGKKREKRILREKRSE